MVPVNYLAVLVSAVASMILGFVWYGPLFSKPWMAAVGMTPEKMEAAKKGMAKSYFLMVVSSLVMAYVMAHVVEFGSSYTGTVGVAAGLMAGAWSWFGFIAPATLGSVLWEGRSWKLWLINNGYYLIDLLIMGAILALWK